jgi:acyl-coenzyme A thioesterase PaaI-like protein
MVSFTDRKRRLMSTKSFQEYYPNNHAHCYGCGRLNEHGLQIKSYWDGEESVCRFRPHEYHTGGFPENVYGGLIASLVDCHGAGTAAAAMARSEGVDPESHPLKRFVTASLQIDFLAPTPIDTTIELRGRVKKIDGRKVVVRISVTAGEKVRARGEVLMIQLPE